jgi:hypothetical protein
MNIGGRRACDNVRIICRTCNLRRLRRVRPRACRSVTIGRDRAEDFVDAIKTGDRRTQLEALRDQLAERMDAAGARDTASIAKELCAVLEDLENLPDGREESTVSARS